MSTGKKIYAAIFLTFVVILGLSSIILFARNNFLPGAKEETENTGKTAAISYAELYPFEEEDNSNEQKSSKSHYSSFVREIARRTNLYLTDNSPLYGNFKSIQTAIKKLNNNDENYYNGTNAIVTLDNGYIAESFAYCPSQETMDSILDFSEWLKDKNISYVTLITPDKSDDSVTTFSKGIPHGYSQLLDEYKAFLAENEIYYIEAKQLLLAENSDFYSWFYKSDHHWNVRASFVTAQATAKFLNDELYVATDAEVLDEANFTLQTYPDSFIGSYGKLLGIEWKEDMEVLYPTKETDFHIEIASLGVDKSGSFDTTLIDQSYLGEEESSYGAFLSGDNALVQIENKTCQNDTKILVIKYSFANSFCPYLANTVRYLDMIDPRHFDGSIRTYIKETQPDAVILCMGVVNEYDEDDIRLE